MRNGQSETRLCCCLPHSSWRQKRWSGSGYCGPTRNHLSYTHVTLSASSACASSIPVCHTTPGHSGKGGQLLDCISNSFLPPRRRPARSSSRHLWMHLAHSRPEPLGHSRAGLGSASISWNWYGQGGRQAVSRSVAGSVSTGTGVGPTCRSQPNWSYLIFRHDRPISSYLWLNTPATSCRRREAQYQLSLSVIPSLFPPPLFSFPHSLPLFLPHPILSHLDL